MVMNIIMNEFTQGKSAKITTFLREKYLKNDNENTQETQGNFLGTVCLNPGPSPSL